MKEELAYKNEQSVDSKIKTSEKPWELSKEDQSFFDRKFKALEFFGNKLKGNKEESNNFSKEAVSKLEGRVSDLNLDSYNPEEINAIKEQVNDLEKRKQEVINHGEEGLKKVDTESSGWSLSPEDQSFFDRKFKAQGEFRDKLDANKGQSLEKSNTEYTPFEEVEKMEDIEKNDDTRLSKKPDMTSKIKPEDNQEKIEDKDIENVEESVEKKEEKPLEPGDEVYSDGNFYKVYDIHYPTAEEEESIWIKGKAERDREFEDKIRMLPFEEGDDRKFRERELFDEQKKKELKEHGAVIKAMINGGMEGITLDNRNIMKITSAEQREKIVAMQKDEEKGENLQADFMGMGVTKRIVDKITGQPGKF